MQRDFPVEIENSSGFSGRKQVISKKKGFTEIVRSFPAEIGNLSGFSGRKQEISKKKRSSTRKWHEIRCQSTKITKIPVAKTNLGLVLHSSSPEPVNFLGAQFSLDGVTIFVWGGTNSHLGGHGPGVPPRGAGSGFVTLFSTSKMLYIFLRHFVYYTIYNQQGLNLSFSRFIS